VGETSRHENRRTLSGHRRPASPERDHRVEESRQGSFEGSELHLEQFIETLERGFGEGFGYSLNLPESKVEFFVDEDPTSSVFEVSLELVGSLNEDDVASVIENLFHDTIRRLRAKVAKLRNEAGGLRAHRDELKKLIGGTNGQEEGRGRSL